MTGDATTEWQTIPPRTFTRLTAAPDVEIYHELGGTVAVQSRRAPCDCPKGMTYHAMNCPVFPDQLMASMS